ESKAESVEFVALYRPRRKGQTLPSAASLKPIEGGYVLTAELSDGRIKALLPTGDSDALEAEGLASDGVIIVHRLRLDGSVVETLDLREE
ncbi:MAG: hypothetical protein GX594_17795, partial [Pirellulaceae bacterium]|nr:hypothetical protein [Pirellulaceae bacterium]